MGQPQAASVLDETQTSDGKREMSTIAFPYQDLDEAIEIAKTVHQLHGSSCTVEQIAAHLEQSSTSSTFKMKISAAKIFKLVTVSQGSVTLTPLGTRICDPHQEKLARVDAFLSVPLYSAVYNNFKTATLPPAAGLEASLGTLGVAEKQRERARQILHRSAQEAGFFQFGTERLVMPAIKASTPAPAVAPVEEPEKKKKQKDDDDEDLHPFIKGLLTKLPKPDEEWTQEGRAKWLETAANIFDLLYKNSDDNNRVISIRVEKDSARQ
jgi:hypothetical protein